MHCGDLWWQFHVGGKKARGNVLRTNGTKSLIDRIEVEQKKNKSYPKLSWIQMLLNEGDQ